MKLGKLGVWGMLDKLTAAETAALAQRVDRPRAWLLRDETLYALARQRPASASELSRLPAMAPGTVRRYGPALLELVQTAAREREPVPMEASRLDADQLAVVARLSVRVKAKAAELVLAPTTLASRRDLERLACGQAVPRLASGWRREVLGELPGA